jgi:hypothetical protein
MTQFRTGPTLTRSIVNFAVQAILVVNLIIVGIGLGHAWDLATPWLDRHVVPVVLHWWILAENVLTATAVGP